jgi:hypothetical protein
MIPNFTFLPPKLTLDIARTLARNFTDASRLPESLHSVELEKYNHSHYFLFEYQIFPPYILRHLAQWKAEGRDMQVGDIIIQRALIPPIGAGICFEFAVRITNVEKNTDRSSFTYETLQGHPEQGTSEFSIEQEPSPRFTIRTRSQPGHWLSEIVATTFTLPYQNWVTKRALQYVSRQYANHNGITE